MLAITEAALLLPIGGAILAAAGACALYSAEVVWWRSGSGVALALQLGMFAAVAVAAGLVGARLRQVGSGGEALAAAVARARHDARIEASDVAEPLVTERTPVSPTLEAIERAYIAWVLQNEGGNKSRAADVLGIDPSTLYRKLARCGDA